MQARAKPLCAVDDTWEDVLGEFKAELKGKSTWSCFCLDGVDKEVILSAPEIMDPKTDCGYGYQHIASLDHLLKTKEIPAASSLKDEKALVDLMDYIHAKELTYLQGYSLVQSYLPFPYFLRLELLKSENPVLYAYCRGVLRTLDCVLRAVFATTIRSDEEFMMVPPELDRQSECPLEEILADLESEAAKSKSPAIAARLRWRKQFLSALSLLVDAKRKSDVEAACDECAAALKTLESDPAMQRTTEPHIAKGLLREKEMAYWVSTMTPTKHQPNVKHAEAMAAYKLMLEQLASVKELFALRSLSSIVDYVEALGARQPLLPVRCLVIVVLFSRDPSESFLYGLPIHQRLLEMIAKDYGSPLYLKIFEGDDATVESVVKYRIHKTADPLKITPEQLMFLRQQTVDAVRQWTSEACKQFLIHLETMLCTRGLAHRRLMKGMTALGQLQEMSYSTDISIFLATQPGVAAEKAADCIRASSVLTLFTNSFVLRAMELVVALQFELDLLSQGEVLPALWYMNFAQRAQMENLAMLCLQNTSFIPEVRINKKTRVPLYNLALSTRVTGTLDASRVSTLDASRMLSDSVFLSACLMEHEGLIDLSSPAKHSLVTLEDTFNHRFAKCFGSIHSPPLTSYRQAIASRPNLSADPSKVPVYAKKASEVASNAATKMNSLLAAAASSAPLTTPGASGAAAAPSPAEEKTRRQSLTSTYGGFEKAARTISASLASLAAVCQDKQTAAKYTATVDRGTLPYIVHFTLHKKE